MSPKKILIISGTHGNEINPIWAVDQFNKTRVEGFKSNSLSFIHGNPKAIRKGSRYIDFDLNRSFNKKLIASKNQTYEVSRAQALLSEYGPHGLYPCHVAVDLHTTTSAMGTSIVVYGRRKLDLCLASILQNKFGCPIYLHEKDQNQTGFLVEAWPCGIVIEVGPVAQNYYDPEIVDRFLIILKFLQNIHFNSENICSLSSSEITLFVHQRSLDYPKDKESNITALIHPMRIGQDWKLVKKGDPLFLNLNNETINYQETDDVYPVFIGESAYKEKNIAMSFTKKEKFKIPEIWFTSFFDYFW